jgi:hypothetical protein
VERPVGTAPLLVRSLALPSGATSETRTIQSVSGAVEEATILRAIGPTTASGSSRASVSHTRPRSRSSDWSRGRYGEAATFPCRDSVVVKPSVGFVKNVCDPVSGRFSESPPGRR